MQTKAPAPTALAESAAGTPAQRSVSFMPGMGASSAHARPQAMTPQRLQQTTSNSARVKQLGAMQMMAAPSQHREAAQPSAASRGGGLPPHLKLGIENLSGISMDGVTVHYNSPQPAQLQAHAFAQGTDIHLGPGQEAHLPHEAWHVVQQAQGRVKPTFQMKTGLPVNDDAGLENEADAMGARALSGGFYEASMPHTTAGTAMQRRSLQHVKQSGSANKIPVQAKLVVAIPTELALAKPEEKLEITDFAVTDYSEIYRGRKSAAGETKEVLGETTGETKKVAGKTKAVDPVLTEIVAEVMERLKKAILTEAGKEDPAGAEGKEIAEAFQANLGKVERQLEKWIENVPGTDSEHNTIYGRKQQYRVYDNYYDLARGLLGWVLAKPQRKIEQTMATQVNENVEITVNINSLMGKLAEKIESLTDAPGPAEIERPTVKNLRQKVIRELRSSISETSTAREAGQTKLDHLGTYRHHFDEKEETEDKRDSIKTGIANNQYEVIQKPFFYSLRDKIVVLHDVMEYFGGYQSWLPPRAGQGLLAEPEARYSRSTTSIHTSGPNIGIRNAHTSDDGKDADGKPDQGRGKKIINLAPYISHATRDERHPTTLLARKYKIPIWSGQSFTAMRMFGLADWVGANVPEKTALAWAIFAFWRKDYDHRAPYAAHTLHEVMDIAQNFDVAYSITDRQGGLRPQQLLTSVDVKREPEEEITFLEEYYDNLIEHIENRYSQFEIRHYGRMPAVALALRGPIDEAVKEQRGRSAQLFAGIVFGMADVLGVIRKSEKLAQKVQNALMEAEAKEAELDAPEIPGIDDEG